MNQRQGGRRLIRLTKNLSAIIGEPFRRRKYLESVDNVTLMSSGSEASSECSTLVDFAIYSTEVTIPSLPRVPTSTSNDHSRVTVPYCDTSEILPKSDSQQDLLDEEDCTWVMPRSRKHSSPKEKSKRKQKVVQKSTRSTKFSVTAVQNGMLDLDERSWV